MKISGFTFVRNAVHYDYPVVESIRSILPLVDEFIVSVGDCTDGTLELIQSIGSAKISIFHSTWDDSLREGGKILAVETDKAKQHVSKDSDWLFYLQADEVVHEKYYDNILAAAKKFRDNKNVEGLLFKYTHFYGTYDYVGDSRKWYNREIRIIRNDPAIHSWKDAQGFRKDGRKMNVKPIDAYIYHYGWVKHPTLQQHKYHNVGIFWSNDQDAQFKRDKDAFFDYLAFADSIQKFHGTHPKVMEERIKRLNWDIPFRITKKNFRFKDRVLYKIEKLTGKRIFDYRNYRII